MNYEKILLNNTSFFNAHRLFQYVVILLAFSIPLSIAAYNLFAVSLFILWIIEGNFKSKWKMIVEQPFFKALWIFYFFMVLSLVWTNNIHQGLEYLRKFYFLILLLPILYTSIDRNRLPQIVSAFLAAMVISEILSYMIFFELMPFKYKESWSSIDPTPFMHHTPYSIFLIFTVILMLIQLIGQKKNNMKGLFYGLFIITMTANLFINAGRTGQFALLVALGIFLMSYLRISFLKTIAYSAVIGGIIFLIAYWSSSNFHDRVNETNNSISTFISTQKPLNDSTGFRFMMWQTASEIICENPIFGVGIGDDRDAYDLVLSKKLINLKNDIEGFSDFHNTYLQIMVWTGIVGLVLFLNVFFVLFKNISNDRELKTIGRVMTGLLLCYMLIGDFPAAYLTVLFVLIIALTLERNDEILYTT